MKAVNFFFALLKGKKKNCRKDCGQKKFNHDFQFQFKNGL
jgi:hypothetical protein